MIYRRYEKGTRRLRQLDSAHIYPVHSHTKDAQESRSLVTKTMLQKNEITPNLHALQSNVAPQGTDTVCVWLRCVYVFLLKTKSGLRSCVLLNIHLVTRETWCIYANRQLLDMIQYCYSRHTLSHHAVIEEGTAQLSPLGKLCSVLFLFNYTLFSTATTA